MAAMQANRPAAGLLMQRLDGQVAVVTGGARGIGRGIAEVLAAEGARVALADVDGEAAETAADALRARGLEALAVATDVTDAGLGRRARRDRPGDVGPRRHPAPPTPASTRSTSSPPWTTPPGTACSTSTSRAPSAPCAPASAPMREQGYGRVVLTSSITGPITGQTGFAHYGASKAAMLGFMRSAAVELAPSGITVNAVCRATSPPRAWPRPATSTRR